MLAAWMEVNEAVWSDSSRRDYASRARFVANDSIGKLGIARLGVADVERWHAAMRRAGVGERAIRNRHSVLRAALAQAVRWEWVPTNVASVARLRQSKQAPRKSISGDDVRAVIRAARTIDPAAALALRLAAVAGLRRSELAALGWSEIDGDRLTVDSSVAIRREEGAEPVLIDAPTKTANQRAVRLDPATPWPSWRSSAGRERRCRRTCSPSTSIRRRRPGWAGGGREHGTWPASTADGGSTI